MLEMTGMTPHQALRAATLMLGAFTWQHAWIALGCAIGAWLMRGAGGCWLVTRSDACFWAKATWRWRAG